MDEKEIRKQLQEVRTSLRRNEEEHAVLVSLVKGFEGWLRLSGLNGRKPTQSQFADVSPAPSEQKAPAFRQAVLQVVKEAQGEPLHVGEILRRAKKLGANTSSKNPENSTDLSLYKWKSNGEPVEKVRARTWIYAEPMSGA